MAGDHISPVNHQVSAIEGDSVTLSCSYDTTSGGAELHWYKQHYEQPPQYILRKGARSNSYSDIPNRRYDSTTSRTSTDLIITSVTLADTALYYCAVDTQ